jgi:hypothetical protein
VSPCPNITPVSKVKSPTSYSFCQMNPTDSCSTFV